MRKLTFPQLSPQWWEAHKGLPSASNFSRILTPKTGKLAAAADDYICELVAETFRLDPPTEAERTSQMNFAMRHGVDCEPEARRWFEHSEGVDVEQVGLCISDCGRLCCSPDGLLGETCGLELKCPQGKTQVRYLLDGGLPDEYRGQVHGSMIVTGRPSWWFVSYARGLPPLKLLVERDEYTAKLEAGLEEFLQRYAAIRAKFLPAQEAAA